MILATPCYIHQWPGRGVGDNTELGMKWQKSRSDQWMPGRASSSLPRQTLQPEKAGARAKAVRGKGIGEGKTRIIAVPSSTKGPLHCTATSSQVHIIIHPVKHHHCVSILSGVLVCDETERGRKLERGREGKRTCEQQDEEKERKQMSYCWN